MKNTVSEFNYSLSEKELKKVAKRYDAAGFYEWLIDNNVDYIVHDMNLTDPNEDYFNVSIPIDDGVCFDVLYCEGALDTATVSEYSEI
jgi:hypothetical protein